MTVAEHWNTTAAERQATYACDELMPEAPSRLTRAVDAQADVVTTFRRLTQLRAAPYSYDLIDNRGRRSPREVLPWCWDLEVGQRVASVFTLASFRPDQEMTLQMDPGPARVFGDVAITYHVSARGEGSRLLAVLRAGSAPGPLGNVRRFLLEWGDLVMMRKQLRTLAALAEGDQQRN
ncbi:hypothetical protein LWF15_34660 [Kineosporia rhizophila]|uniref:hypothetical protein n=1 Tax=Kineosporia rhizophila TaxID=84633 RepID=UPI001E54FED8|nr:hypothetical protein [Kineosporia rhizophila]MCE0540648.1 hypothetical protein [Kineosporia rhizophila]